MNTQFQVRENMLAVIQNFLANAPPQCDVEISVKYNLAKESSEQVKKFSTRTSVCDADRLPTKVPSRAKLRTPVLVRKLRSEERVALKDAVPLFTPNKTTQDSFSYDLFAPMKNPQYSDPETDDMPTSELFPVKKALRYNKNSGKYDKIS
ncbi:hypothetical protein DICVIV_00970 [Dictyocaulus viviparus]|uniref:Uncharacterized protein n=1 Tax=Dictyocaulus viviparus TaxID=29172 RepID=A0A0D8Y7F7_DICVI|nr:hypothetical protein DICVIV_00970 [Dictyocaulus viviparus]